MAPIPLTPPDGAGWTLEVAPIADGVGLIVGFDLAGEWHTVRVDMSRTDSRTLASDILAAGGDATERTFPKPPTSRARHD